MIRIFAVLALASTSIVGAASAAVSVESISGPEARVAEQVRKQIVKLPFYSIFDYITFRLDDGVVRLDGQVHRPSLRKSAERVAEQVEGVDRVVNRIEILPTSFHDDRIRRSVYYALYSDPVLNRYALQARPPIHIIVKNGDVSLEGVVSRQMEKNVAGIRANTVSGVFSVSNNLRVERS